MFGRKLRDSGVRAELAEDTNTVQISLSDLDELKGGTKYTTEMLCADLWGFHVRPLSELPSTLPRGAEGGLSVVWVQRVGRREVCKVCTDGCPTQFLFGSDRRFAASGAAGPAAPVDEERCLRIECAAGGSMQLYTGNTRVSRRRAPVRHKPWHVRSSDAPRFVSHCSTPPTWSC
jgi:hypothetical protein